MMQVEKEKGVEMEGLEESKREELKEEVKRFRERMEEAKKLERKTKRENHGVALVFVVYCLGLLVFCWWLGGVLEREGWFVDVTGGKKTEDKTYRLEVSLEDVYNQQTLSFEGEKIKICDHCDGLGVTQPDPPVCPVCQGRGVQYRTVRLSPHQSFKTEERCSRCGGSGVHPDYICPVCHGQRHVRSTAQHTVSIPPGVQDRQVVVLEGESDEYVGHQPGDVRVVLYIKKHPLFDRDGDSLVYNLTVLLKEALLGFEKKITHLDGKKVDILSAEIVGPGDELVVEGGGLPKEEGGRGELRVRMKVDYKKNRFLSPKQKEELIELLSKDKK